MYYIAILIDDDADDAATAAADDDEDDDLCFFPCTADWIGSLRIQPSESVSTLGTGTGWALFHSLCTFIVLYYVWPFWGDVCEPAGTSFLCGRVPEIGHWVNGVIFL